MLRSSSYDYKYINGNYLVSYNGQDLRKEAFRMDEELRADFPDSIDLKISNRCSRGCPFCHENSTKAGKILDLEKTKEILSQLPELPIEFAIGGGNILETPGESSDIVNWLLAQNHRVRCTVRYEDLLTLTEEQKELLKMFEGIGVSISDVTPEMEEVLNNKQKYDYSFDGFGADLARHFNNLLFGDKGKKDKVLHTGTPKYVIHIISGVFPVEKLDKFLHDTSVPTLILGYKQWGRARNTELPESLPEFERTIKQYLYKNRYEIEAGKYDRKSIVFDNLALEQLHIKDSLTDEEWDTLYMGDEGTHSMYIDAVAGQFARNSRSPERVSWDDCGLLDYFKSLHK